MIVGYPYLLLQPVIITIIVEMHVVQENACTLASLVSYYSPILADVHPDYRDGTCHIVC